MSAISPLIRSIMRPTPRRPQIGGGPGLVGIEEPVSHLVLQLAREVQHVVAAVAVLRKRRGASPELEVACEEAPPEDVDLVAGRR